MITAILCHKWGNTIPRYSQPIVNSEIWSQLCRLESVRDDEPCLHVPFPAGPRIPGIAAEGPEAQQFEQRSPEGCAGVAQGSDCSAEGVRRGRGMLEIHMGLVINFCKWAPTCSGMSFSANMQIQKPHKTTASRNE